MKSVFSLIEILVVLAIASILATLGLPAALKARQRGLTGKVEATLASIEAALVLYETDFGDYPPGSGTAGRLVKLLSEPVESPRWKGPYFGYKKRDYREGELIDPWGMPYRYHYPQSIHANTPFLLYSCGPDRTERTPDDLGNW